jgi:hypothetical protein
MEIQPFASEQFARHFWQYQAPDPEVLATLLVPPVKVELLDRGSMLIRWQRGEAYFTEFGGQFDKATISVMAVSTQPTDVAPWLQALAQEAGNNVRQKPANWLYRVPRLAWQIALGLVVGFLIAFVGAMLGSAINESAGSIFTITGFVVIFAYFVLWPRVHRKYRLKERWQEGLANGDHDGTVRRALQSVGVDLP